MKPAVRLCAILIGICIFTGCSKKSSGPAPVINPPVLPVFLSQQVQIDNATVSSFYYGSSINPVLKFTFNAPVNRNTAAGSISFKDKPGLDIAHLVTYEKNDSTLIIQSLIPLNSIAKYTVSISENLKSIAGSSLSSALSIHFITNIDSSRKFPLISDEELLTLVQKKTFNYFWDFAHPVSKLARERSNGDDKIVTSGGSGFGIMAVITGIHRNFISRAEGLARLKTVISFLKDSVQTFHGAYPHWLNGETGKAIPFSQKDNGADLVETSYLIQGLLTARQYFNGADTTEMDLRNDINTIVNRVKWDWFRKNNENVLYWHWSPNYGWDLDMQIKGWNECLITYVLAASSPTHAIPKIVYDNGWASNGIMKNGNTYFGYQLPLGPDHGGPLFFSHYSFLGINPNGLSDAYANYQIQTKRHTLINYNYCKANPQNYFGYSDSVWGLTAGDIENGYHASSPIADKGYITPTAALSSFPYTPVESLQALKFFYYVLGDKIWKEYGFTDAFSIHQAWFAGSFLAIDQGPIIIMIENYRSGLLWNLFMSCPEVKTGMRNLGFTSPFL